MEILLIIVIGVISAIVSAASKSKHKQSDDAPPRPFISDIQRALSFFNDDEEQTNLPPPVSEHINETVQYSSQPDMQEDRNTERLQPLVSSSPWEGLENNVFQRSSEGTLLWNRGEQADVDLMSNINTMPYLGTLEIERDKQIETELTDKPQTLKYKSSLKLLFGSNDIIRGVVYSEILTRKRR